MTLRRYHRHPSEQNPRTATVEWVAYPAAEEFEVDWDTAWEQNLLQVALERTKGCVCFLRLVSRLEAVLGSGRLRRYGAMPPEGGTPNGGG